MIKVMCRFRNEVDVCEIECIAIESARTKRYDVDIKFFVSERSGFFFTYQRVKKQKAAAPLLNGLSYSRLLASLP